MRYILLPFLLSLSCVCLSASNEVTTKDKKHIIVGAQLSGLFHLGKGTENRGVYFDIIHKALIESGLSEEFEINVMPMPRVLIGTNMEPVHLHLMEPLYWQLMEPLYWQLMEPPYLHRNRST